MRKPRPACASPLLCQIKGESSEVSENEVSSSDESSVFLFSLPAHLSAKNHQVVRTMGIDQVHLGLLCTPLRRLQLAALRPSICALRGGFGFSPVVLALSLAAVSLLSFVAWCLTALDIRWRLPAVRRWKSRPFIEPAIVREHYYRSA